MHQTYTSPTNASSGQNLSPLFWCLDDSVKPAFDQVYKEKSILLCRTQIKNESRIQFRVFFLSRGSQLLITMFQVWETERHREGSLCLVHYDYLFTRVSLLK